jgi:ParB/RepB/Spo0J family partition protein
MPPKATDRIKALQQQRAAALAPQQIADPLTVADGSSHSAPAPSVIEIQSHFGGALDSLVRDRQIRPVPVAQIAPDEQPTMRQPRLLPVPDELLVAGQPVPIYAALVAELLRLGQSLRERQIQPIVVYPGTSPTAPAVRYRILVGQRRWTAAYLVGLETLDTVIVATPSPSERIRIQYAENEAREEFSDMERAWALQQMKQALDDAPWEVVEAKLQLSTTRRHQLMRLLTFSPAQQQLIARLRLQETQIRPLHTAVRSQTLNLAHADGVLNRLSVIAIERATRLPTTEEAGGRLNSTSPRQGIDGPTVARLVAQTQRTTGTPTSTPRWVAPLQAQLGQTRQSIQRIGRRVAELGPTERADLHTTLERLYEDVAALLAALDKQAQSQVVAQADADLGEKRGGESGP